MSGWPDAKTVTKPRNDASPPVKVGRRAATVKDGDSPMTPDRRSELVKSLACEIGFGRCGIAAAGPHSRGEYLRRWLADGKAGAMKFMHSHTASRVDVLAWLPNSRSVIVVALDYRQPEPRVDDDSPRGRVAKYAWGQDYHSVMKELLALLVGLLRRTLGEEFESKICVDTSAITEREIAAAAGVGWIGKNTMVVHPAAGSYFVLGEIITSLDLAPDPQMPDHCGSCTRCLDACPTQAFVAPHQMDARRCISYLTIEHRSEIYPALPGKMGDWVFGCDVCQDVCPFNQQAPMGTEARLSPQSADVARPALDQIIAWDKPKYLAHVTNRPVHRARLRMWQRNAAIARANIESARSLSAAAAESSSRQA